MMNACRFRAGPRTGGGRAVFISAAEISGDLLGAILARELRRLEPDLELFGLGGPQMAASGVEVLADITHSSAIGLLDSIGQAPSYVLARRLMRRVLAERPPAAVLAVDAPGINFPLLRAARRRGVTTIYHACPQTWLWNPAGATARLQGAADHVVAMLPEEAALYRRAGLRTIHHGHPIVDIVERVRDEGEAAAGPGTGPIPIGLLPGSRIHELRRLLPLMYEAANLVAAELGPIELLVGIASAPAAGLVESAAHTLGPRVRMKRVNARRVLTASRVTLAASGTVLLEACLLDAPVVMTYRIDPVSHWIGYHLLRIHEKLPHYALPNLLARERIVPELVQREATPERMARELCRLVQDAESRRRMRDGFSRVREALGRPGATRAIAREILAVVPGAGATARAGNDPA